jgi:hypothetical protein
MEHLVDKVEDPCRARIFDVKELCPDVVCRLASSMPQSCRFHFSDQIILDSHEPLWLSVQKNRSYAALLFNGNEVPTPSQDFFECFSVSFTETRSWSVIIATIHVDTADREISISGT